MNELQMKVEAMRQKSLAKAEENRRRMPSVTKFVDGIREIFGDGVRVTFASENGVEMGRRSDPGILLSDTVIGSMAIKK